MSSIWKLGLPSSTHTQSGGKDKIVPSWEKEGCGLPARGCPVRQGPCPEPCGVGARQPEPDPVEKPGLPVPCPQGPAAPGLLGDWCCLTQAAAFPSS